MKKLDWEYIDALMPRRAAESSKNDYGRILCVCGSAGYTGAAFFAAQGAVRMGSGVVTLAVPERAWPVLAVKLSEPVVRPSRARRTACSPSGRSHGCSSWRSMRTRCSSAADWAARTR